MFFRCGNFVLVGYLLVVEGICPKKIILGVQVAAGAVAFKFFAEIDRQGTAFFGQAFAPDDIAVEGLPVAGGGDIADALVDARVVGSACQ